MIMCSVTHESATQQYEYKPILQCITFLTDVQDGDLFVGDQ